MTSKALSYALRSTVVLSTATALVFAGSTAATAQPATAASATATATAQPGSSESTIEQTPAPTAEELDFLTEQLGPAAGEIERAQQQAAAEEGRVQVAALPIAGAAIAAAAWCASGALGSVPTSVLDDLTNGGEGTDYARNAIIGCVAGNIGSWAWKVLPGWAKEKAVAAVAAFIIKYIR